MYGKYLLNNPAISIEFLVDDIRYPVRPFDPLSFSVIAENNKYEVECVYYINSSTRQSRVYYKVDGVIGYTDDKKTTKSNPAVHILGDNSDITGEWKIMGSYKIKTVYFDNPLDTQRDIINFIEKPEDNEQSVDNLSKAEVNKKNKQKLNKLATMNGLYIYRGQRCITRIPLPHKGSGDGDRRKFYDNTRHSIEYPVELDNPFGTQTNKSDLRPENINRAIWNAFLVIRENFIKKLLAINYPQEPVLSLNTVQTPSSVQSLKQSSNIVQTTSPVQTPNPSLNVVQTTVSLQSANTVQTTASLQSANTVQTTASLQSVNTVQTTAPLSNQVKILQKTPSLAKASIPASGSVKKIPSHESNSESRPTLMQSVSLVDDKEHESILLPDPEPVRQYLRTTLPKIVALSMLDHLNSTPYININDKYSKILIEILCISNGKGGDTQLARQISFISNNDYIRLAMCLCDYYNRNYSDSESVCGGSLLLSFYREIFPNSELLVATA
jgi:hypothetical protein